MYVCVQTQVYFREQAGYVQNLFQIYFYSSLSVILLFANFYIDTAL